MLLPWHAEGARLRERKNERKTNEVRIKQEKVRKKEKEKENLFHPWQTMVPMVPRERLRERKYEGRIK